MPTNSPQLCQNVNQVLAPAGSAIQGFPINTGDFNGRKVALDSAPDRIYEIECMNNPLDTTGAPASVSGYSMETCIKYCNDNAATCNYGVIFTNSTNGPYLGSCRIATGFATSNPPKIGISNSIGNAQRIARLISPTLYPAVNDAVYYQSRIAPAGDLGFCKGPSSSNYNGSFVALQYFDTTYTGDTNQIFQISCGPYSYFGSGGSAIDVSAQEALYSLDSSTPENCARLCNYNYKANSGPRCQAWQRTATACQMYSERYNVPANAPRPVANPAVTAAGVRAAGFTQTNTPNYKRDVAFNPEDGPAMPQPIGRYHRRVAYGGDSFQDIKPDYIIKGL